MKTETTTTISNTKRLRRLASLLVICHLSFSSAVAQTVAVKEVFKAIPDSLIPYMSLNDRLDFIDFKESGMVAKVTNALNGSSLMDALNDRFLSLKLNEASTMQLRLLPVSTPVDSVQQVLCVVRTLGVSSKQSIVSFYSRRWHPLDISLDGCFSMDDLLNRPADMSKERFQELRKMMNPSLYEAELSPDTDVLTVRLSAIDVSADDIADLEKVRLPIKLKWNGKRFNKF